MKVLLGAVVAAVVIATGIVYFGLFDVAATQEPAAIVRWFLETTRDQSVERRARDIAVPDLRGSELRLEGAGDYAMMCAYCHTAPGHAPSPLAKGLNPAPPDLAESAQDMSAAELFWTVKNGIRMSGMPAWGPTHSDDELWSVVAFVQTLPSLDAAGYAEMVERARAHGHHHDEAIEEEHSH